MPKTQKKRGPVIFLFFFETQKSLKQRMIGHALRAQVDFSAWMETLDEVECGLGRSSENYMWGPIYRVLFSPNTRGPICLFSNEGFKKFKSVLARVFQLIFFYIYINAGPQRLPSFWKIVRGWGIFAFPVKVHQRLWRWNTGTEARSEGTCRAWWRWMYGGLRGSLDCSGEVTWNHGSSWPSWS